MNTKKLTILGIFVSVIAFGMYWIFVGDFRFFKFSNKGSDWADFGSYAGGIFAALAFLIVVYQNYERDKEQRKQDFERTFFMMLEQQNIKLTELINKKVNEQSIVENIYKEIMNYPRNEFTDSLRCEMEIGSLRESYTEINAYFLNLYRILKFIYENKELNIDNKYSSLLRSYIPKNLLIILSYHLYRRDSSYNEYIGYINEFSFFEHLDLFVLETEYIYNITKYDKKLIYELINFIRLGRYIEVRVIIENAGYTPGKNRNKLKQIFEAKITKQPIKADFRSPYHEIFYENVFFYSLCTFSDQAFKGNIDYENIKVVYSQFVNYIKSKNNNE
ncbi:putative phage abortive infection protein [Actinobacillus equuli subsp. haemolyticus]|uniref:putative phage abortive infection protein n=1 Tax=Actinobacillus equuli TaxID=718 RepID=UPI002441D1B2|nr:putative phage abortive infection protein [Actinobacillus equuli]WGE63227.1 putative phage abortive infection protein [Actinobacillus equuli subsp. haemolyticus]